MELQIYSSMSKLEKWRDNLYIAEKCI